MKHLTAADRGRIETLLQLQHSNATIARKLGRHKSTIGREIAKGTNHVGTYTAEYAQLAHQERRVHTYNTPKLTRYPELGIYVTDRIKAGWDPSQIAGRLKAMRASPRVCAETIYAWVYDSPANQTQRPYQYLRYGKKRRGWHHVAERTRQHFKLPNRVSIHDRPAIVEQRSRVGDWEGDLVIYPTKQSIATLYERLTSLALLAHVPGKQSQPICTELGRQLAGRPAHTLTLDNGPEFYRHRLITEQSGVQVYFADPYTSWQRGGNENLNRQLRAYLPRGTDITDLTATELAAIQAELNHKPRQRTGLAYANRNLRLAYAASRPGTKLSQGCV